MGGEGGIVRGCAAHPSLTLGTAVAQALRRPAPPLSRRLVEPKGSNPAPVLANENKKGPEVPFYFHIGGEGGIRTLEGLLTLTPLAGVRLRPLGHLSGGRNHKDPERSVAKKDRNRP